MLLVCPNCESSYSVADEALGEKGRSVRCARCKQVWFAAAPKPEPALSDGFEEWQPRMPDRAAETDQPFSASGDSNWPPAADATPHVDDAPPVAPDHVGDLSEEPPSTDIEQGDTEIDYAEARRRSVMRKRKKKARGHDITTWAVAAGLAGVVIALFAARESIVRALPQTASLYARLGMPVNLRGVEFADLKTAYEVQDGVRVLVVEGELRNAGSAIQRVPNLRFALRNTQGLEIYSWTSVPERNVIVPGEAQRFRSLLAAPPGEGRDVRVKFVQAHDISDGGKL